MCWTRVTAPILVFLALGFAGSSDLAAQDEIQIDGVSVVTTETDQDTTYAGQFCPAGSALVGFTKSSELACECFPGRSMCPEACFDLQVDPDHCGSCETSCDAGEVCSSGTCGECSTTFQDCPVPGEGCYPNIFANAKECLPEGDPLGQGQECDAINNCMIGFGCSVLNAAQDALVCARLCDPDNLSGPNGTPRCVAELGGDYTCIRATDYWGDLEPSMDNVGWCLDSKLMAGPVFLDQADW